MKVLKNIGKRFSGTYRREELDMNDARVQYLERALVQGKAADSRLADGFRELIKAIRRENRRIRFGFWLGGATARLAYGSYAPYAAIAKMFDNGDGRLAFKDIFLPPALNNGDKREFGQQFFDFLLTHVTGDEIAAIGDPLCQKMCLEDPYEIDDRIRMRPGDVVLDCGANMGLFSCLAAARGCRVHAFEPMRYIRENYVSKAAAWNRNIVVHPYALSDKKQQLVFKLAPSIGSSREIDAGAAAGTTGGDPSLQTVEAVTLDDFVEEQGLDAVNFIKADIEGAERKMLAGAARTIRRFAPVLSICTYHLPDDPAVLRQLIRDIEPRYAIVERKQKIYAYMR